MKKTKGFGVAAPVMEYSPYDLYEDLHKETESMRKNLQTKKERRSTLLAEVEFLRRRRKFLMQNQSSNTPVIKSKSNVKAKKSTGKGTSIGRATGFDSNLKGKTNSVKGTCFTNPSLMFDLNQMQQKVFSGKEEPTLRSSSSVLHLNQKERLHSRKEATARSVKPVFDLNQISREEEELQAQTSSVGTDDFKRSSIRVGSDEQRNEVKISARRNTGDGPNRTGKRKISWQDQVALRV
ncbi:Detected protein of unknown function [Hibiscus syriacus]|uniref:Uncharacterized protein n=1 Tax=Hibiscus syriacus TaxID=106335 RepID=A0A6A3AB84_HIBSY|nr:uncharacterized protein LOC120132233 [Hibiscus syriacus]KAE8700435.1 Detected protein of unknown function [Hibiscus syriacus]